MVLEQLDILGEEVLPDSKEPDQDEHAGTDQSGSRLRSITRGRSVTIAWELGKGARPTSAWGANKSVNQMFFTRS